MDMATTDEVFNFIVDNTFVDGVALSERFPGAKEWLASVQA